MNPYLSTAIDLAAGLGRMCVGLAIVAVIAAIGIALVSWFFELMDGGP